MAKKQKHQKKISKQSSIEYIKLSDNLLFGGIRPDEKLLSPEEIATKRIVEWSMNPIPRDRNELQLFNAKFNSRTKVLQLQGLKLKKFPESLRGLTNIELLNLTDNKIQEVPEWIGELKNLKAIDLGINQVRELPKSILQLYQLKGVYLRSNNLESLPKGLNDLPIDDLSLIGNPKLEIPASILTRPAKEILRYYFESREKDGQPLLELKLLLVGRGKAGKTTLVKRLADEPPNEEESETHSISIRELTLKCPHGNVRTRAWDFGGQEILHSTHQFFLTERSLYLLVLEPRTGLAQRDAEYWLKLIENQGGGSPVIVALNWSYGRKWHIDEIKLKRKFPFIVDFISTDALKGDGIEELQKSIIGIVQNKMPEVWLPFPARWRAIKDQVASMKNNFLTYRQYSTICKKFGETRPDAQADLAGILHALGLALYFGKDPRLHDTRVLNPGWVTGGVYAVIRSQLVERNHGQLFLSDVNEILKEAEEKKVIKVFDYPAKTHSFILELMRAFQLCYASEEEKGKPKRYLVPELLPEFEPKMRDSWDRVPVRLRYRYNVLPSGLLPRFIVQTHALSEGEPHWRYGVVLKHADAQALIREESDRSELHVFVLGENIEARGVLVAIVRRELELLHASMKMQSIEELELTGENDQWISVRSLREVEQPDQSKQKLPVLPEGTAEVDVPKELDKIIPAEAREIDRDQSKTPVPVRLFVSYAHEDERQLKRLDAILDVLEQQHGLTSWHDKRLIAGEEWDAEIRQRLEEMDIFLFIASQSSLVRPYIKDPELERAKARREAKEIEVLIVKLEACASDDDQYIGKLQRLATKFKSIAEAPLKSTAWEQVRKDLLPVIKKVRDKKAKYLKL
jgi:internalin A